MFSRRPFNESRSFSRSLLSSGSRWLFARGWRRVLCLVLIIGLLALPDAGYAVSAATEVAVNAARDIIAPVPIAISWVKRVLHSSAKPVRQETTVDRSSRVSNIEITPNRMVGYQNQRIAFTALGHDAQGGIAQGAHFFWSSSDTTKLQIDDAGQATLLSAGLVWVTAATTNVSKRVPVVVRPGLRPLQTDDQWQIEQDQLQPDGAVSATPGVVGALFDSVGETLMPTVHAQTGGGDGGDFGYDELWSEPRNLVGTPEDRAETSSAIGTVLPESSNFAFPVPVANLPGRGLPLDVSMHYNSRIWSRHGSAVTFNAVNSWPYIGFSLSFGRILTYAAGSNTKFVLIDDDGTRHYLGSGPGGTTATYQSNDGSHITYVGNATTGGTLRYNSGLQKGVALINNRLLVNSLIDANGNYISIAYLSQSPPGCSSGAGFQWKQAINWISDTLGRIIQFNYDSCNNLISITAPGYNGTNTTVAQFDYAVNWGISTSFSGLTVENMPSGKPVLQLSHVYYPASNTGYKFTYSAYGMISTVSLRKQMSYNSGTGVISDGTEKAYVSFNYPATASSLTDAPGFTQWTQSPAATSGGTATWSFTTAAGSGTKSFTITSPDSSVLVLTRSDNTGAVDYGLMTQSEVKTSTGTSLAKTVTSYANDGGGQPQVANVISYDDGTPTPNQTKVDYDYDSYGNVTNMREYGFQVSGSWAVRRRTHTVYKTDSSYVNAYLRSLAIEKDTYDAQLDTNDANDVLVAKTTYTIDDYAAMSGMENYGGTAAPPGHLSSYDTTKTVRGNLTGRTLYTDVSAPTSISWLMKIDIFGNEIQRQLACCNVQTVTFGGTNDYALAESVTKGASGGTQLTSSTSFDFNTSVADSTTAPDGLVTTLNSLDNLQRPTLVTAPTGATETKSYNDNTPSVSTSLSYTEGTTVQSLSMTTTYDTWGRVIKQVDVNGSQVNTTYDNMGRVASVSNPFTAGGSPSYWTTYSYDELGRNTTTTLPDGQTVTSSYNGNAVILTDQVNRKIQHVKDGLGRMVTVDEQDSSGNLTQATSYTYDCLNNMTQVNQGGQLRSYKYDAISRLLYENIPERSATINDGTGTFWTNKYTYTTFNALATRQDARGVVTTFSYDSLNRLYQVTYNTVSGVTTAPALTYTYDSDSIYGTTATGKLLRVDVGTDYQERYTFDSNYRFATLTHKIGSRSYTLTYNSYNQANQPTQVTYPSGQTLYFSHDSHGRLTAVSNHSGGSNGTDYLSNVTYNISGQATGDLLGNGVTEQVSYDAVRRQMVTQNAGTVSPYTNRLNLTYSYAATTGQMGVGSTAGDANQLMSISGTINGATESAAYTYDNYGRLVTSNQTSNGSSAQRRFAYDRWGNRTGVWDATSGGTQIQSIALVTSSSIPNNQIASVTTTGTVSYTYDAAGNVTNDGAHTYTYDSENRVVSVDSGSTASYAYDDHNRRYKKTVGSTVTHYIWEGGGVIAEHNGSTGAVLTDYIQNGSRLLAKVAGGTTSYFLNDRLSTRLSLNGSGSVIGQQAHLPFGEDFAESGTQEKHHFTSYESDPESGVDYGVNRYHNQAVGRFNVVDLLASSSKKGVPQSWNRYAYSMNNPINMRDPLGLEDFDSDPPAAPDLDNPCAPFGPDLVFTGWGVEDRTWYCLKREGPISADNPDPEQSGRNCSFSFNSKEGSTPLGIDVYTYGGRTPPVDPFDDDIGGYTRADSKGKVWWYYFLENILKFDLMDGDNPQDWTTYVDSSEEGDFTIDLGNGKKKSASNSMHLAGEITAEQNKGYLTDPNRLIWLDTPGQTAKYNGNDIVDGKFTFTFKMQGLFRGVPQPCHAYYQLILRVTNKTPVWNGLGIPLS